MHSPTEPGSPQLSDGGSSDSPPPDAMDDISLTIGRAAFDEPVFGIPGSKAGKRAQTRGARTLQQHQQRRKDTVQQGWEGAFSGDVRRGPKDELVDSSLVETLRNRFGDPFDDAIVKNSA